MHVCHSCGNCATSHEKIKLCRHLMLCDKVFGEFPQVRSKFGATIAQGVWVWGGFSGNGMEVLPGCLVGSQRRSHRRIQLCEGSLPYVVRNKREKFSFILFLKSGILSRCHVVYSPIVFPKPHKAECPPIDIPLHPLPGVPNRG
jgi:hypothetical protein